MINNLDGKDPTAESSDNVDVDDSPQFRELSSWLRGDDLHEKKLPGPEHRHAVDARRTAFLDVLKLFEQRKRLTAARNLDIEQLTPDLILVDCLVWTFPED